MVTDINHPLRIAYDFLKEAGQLLHHICYSLETLDPSRFVEMCQYIFQIDQLSSSSSSSNFV